VCRISVISALNESKIPKRMIIHIMITKIIIMQFHNRQKELELMELLDQGSSTNRSRGFLNLIILK
jgi:hypothetical protein